MTTRGLGHAIDFGMSTSAIAVCQPGRRTSYVPSPGGQVGSWSIPTSIYVDLDRSVLVGNAADNARQADENRPDAYRSEFKRDFGLPHSTMVRDTPMTPADMATHVLRCLRQLAQARLPGDPEHVVITVPASWEAWRHAALREAATAAGYADAVISLIPEPVAALADAFAGQRLSDEITTLVYDLGGGTFDCAVARGTAGRFEVLGTPGGIGDIGGTDFDGALLALLADQQASALGALLDGPADDLAILGLRGSLRRDCERIKWELSQRDVFEDMLVTVRPPVWLTVSRSDFETRIRPLVAETISECERMLRQLGMSWDDVDRVLPTGGSTKVPLVQRMLGDASDRVVLRAGDPARAVVSGAAVLCHDALAGNSLERYARALPDAEGSQLNDQAGTSAPPAGPARASEIAALLDKHKDKLPRQRQPNILICGQRGTGKTTTVNTLFAEVVGEIDYFSRGSAQDELYEWESDGHRIDVVDLPGPDGAGQRGKKFRAAGRRRVAEADGFIVVVAPPHPASQATIDTVTMLLSCGVDLERIVFAYNRLGDISAKVGGRMRHLTLAGPAGPATKDDARLIELARKAFQTDITTSVRHGTRPGRLPLERVVPYDALSGWNIVAVLNAVLEALPGDAPVTWRNAASLPPPDPDPGQPPEQGASAPAAPVAAPPPPQPDPASGPPGGNPPGQPPANPKTRGGLREFDPGRNLFDEE